MKKFFTTLLFALICMLGYSQFTQVDGDFVYTTDFTAENAHKKIVQMLNTFNSTTQAAEIKTNEDNLVKAEVVFNVAAKYNPFAGSFVENFQMDATFKIDGDNVELVCDNFYTIFVYSGYGTNKQVRSYVERNEEYEAALEGLNNGTLSGKQKKEAKSTVSDWEESSAAINQEFNKRWISTLKKKIK